MRQAELVEYLSGGRNGSLKSLLDHWIHSSPRTKAFFESYAKKIRKKLKNTIKDSVTEDTKDILFELEIAHLLLQNEEMDIEYEKFGDGPDFTISPPEGSEFNLEVKRIRDSAANQRLSEWRDNLTARISSIPSSLAFRLDIDPPILREQTITVLEEETESIYSAIERAILHETNNMLVDQSITIRIPNIRAEVGIELSKPSGKTDHSYTSYHGGWTPSLYKHEVMRFVDAIIEKRHQLIEGMPNVLVFSTGSNTHDEHHLQTALEIIHNASENDDHDLLKQRDLSREDLQILLANLSGIVFRTKWIGQSTKQGFVWKNRNASVPLPGSTWRLLEAITNR